MGLEVGGVLLPHVEVALGLLFDLNLHLGVVAIKVPQGAAGVDVVFVALEDQQGVEERHFLELVFGVNEYFLLVVPQDDGVVVAFDDLIAEGWIQVEVLEAGGIPFLQALEDYYVSLF